MPTIACSPPENDSALMRFNHATTTDPWPVSEAMADIVTSRCASAQNRGRHGYYGGAAGEPLGFGPDKQPVKTPDPQQIAAAKARTGLQHLTVINHADRQYLQKTSRICLSISPPLAKAMPPIIWLA